MIEYSKQNSVRKAKCEFKKGQLNDTKKETKTPDANNDKAGKKEAHTYISLPPIVDIWFQFLFHSPPGVLFTFPSRYSFTIGHQVVFSFTQWSGQIPAEFHVLRGTWVYND